LFLIAVTILTVSKCRLVCMAGWLKW